MRTQPERKACEVYCITGNGTSGSSAAQVSGAYAQRLARNGRCQKEIFTYLNAVISLFDRECDSWRVINAFMVNIFVLLSCPCVLNAHRRPWESRQLKPRIVCLGLLPTL